MKIRKTSADWELIFARLITDYPPPAPLSASPLANLVKYGEYSGEKIRFDKYAASI